MDFINGIEEKNATLNHDKTVSKKACLKDIFLVVSLKENNNTNPIKKVRILENKKTCQSSFFEKKSTAIGRLIAKAVRQRRIPIT